MPKIIEGAKEAILKNAKQRLFEKGYLHLSLREVAKLSGIATGTIYNYFENKDSLIASIMSEDWDVALEEMDRCVESATDVVEGMEGLIAAIVKFREIYEVIWEQPAANVAFVKRRHEHGAIRKQIAERVDKLFDRLAYGHGKRYSQLLAELILEASGEEELKESLLHAVKYVREVH